MKGLRQRRQDRSCSAGLAYLTPVPVSSAATMPGGLIPPLPRRRDRVGWAGGCERARPMGRPQPGEGHHRAPIHRFEGEPRMFVATTIGFVPLSRVREARLWSPAAAALYPTCRQHSTRSRPSRPPPENSSATTEPRPQRSIAWPNLPRTCGAGLPAARPTPRP